MTEGAGGTRRSTESESERFSFPSRNMTGTFLQFVLRLSEIRNLEQKDGYLLGLAILIFGSRKFLQFSYFWVSQFFAKTFLTFGSRSFLERVSSYRDYVRSVLGLSVNKIAVG